MAHNAVRTALTVMTGEATFAAILFRPEIVSLCYKASYAICREEETLCNIVQLLQKIGSLVKGVEK
jgi:hypothetical protein